MISVQGAKTSETKTTFCLEMRRSPYPAIAHNLARGNGEGKGAGESASRYCHPENRQAPRLWARGSGSIATALASRFADPYVVLPLHDKRHICRRRQIDESGDG